MSDLRLDSDTSTSSASDAFDCFACRISISNGGIILRFWLAKNLQCMFTSRRLLKGPSSCASFELGSARGGRVGGERICASLSVLPVRDAGDVNKAMSSGEYAGGRDDSTPFIIGSGFSAPTEDKKGWNHNMSSTERTYS